MGSPEKRSRHIRFICIGWVIVSLIGLVWSLATLNINRSATAEAGNGNLQNLWPFWIASACAWLGLTGIWITSRSEISTRPYSQVAAFILFIAIVARLAVLLTHQPVLSDDIYRYVFDGRNVAHGINPYLIRPQDRLNTSSENWPGESELVQHIGHKEYFTIYLPTSQYVFGAIAFFVGSETSSPRASTNLFRTSFIIIDVILISLLLVAVNLRKQSPWYVALYAWHPLSITEIAGSGHQDVIGIALLVAALLLFSRRPTSTARPMALLTLSILVKPVAAFVCPLILKGKSFRTWATATLSFLIVTVITVSPFWIIPSNRNQAISNWQETATVMAEKWAHFGSIYESVLWTINKTSPIEKNEASWQKQELQQQLARFVCLILLGLVLFAIWHMNRDMWGSARAMLFAIVLLSTTAYPWYLLWALAIGVMKMSPALWIATLTLPWGYAVFGDVANWTVPTWVIFMAYVPVYIALLIDLVLKWSASRVSIANDDC